MYLRLIFSLFFLQLDLDIEINLERHCNRKNSVFTARSLEMNGDEPCQSGMNIKPQCEICTHFQGSFCKNRCDRISTKKKK